MIKKFICFFAYSNLLVSVGAFLLSVQSIVLFNLKLGDNWLPLLLIFFSTLFLYNYQRVIGFGTKSIHLKSKRHEWIDVHKTFLLALTICSFIIAFVLGFFIITKQYVALSFVVFFVAFFYSTPLYRKKNKLLRLRDLPFAKLFLVGVIWSTVVVVFPLANHFHGLEKNKIFALFLIQFLFIVSITVPFDIRDMTIDEYKKIRTLPLVFGIKKTKIFAYIAAIMCLLISIFFFFPQPELWISELVVLPIVFYLIKKSFPTNSELYFTFYMDGLLILKPAVLLILIYIKNYL